MRKFFVGVCLCIALIMPFFADPAQAQGYDFTTKDYSVTMDVHEDFSFDITEDITVNFSEPRHGIFRSVPLKGNYYFYDAQEEVQATPFYGKISNVQTNVDKDISTKNGIYTIRLGNKNTTVIGEQPYQIRYRWQSSDDLNEDMDWLYFNILPHFWKSPIEGGKITIHMPKAFDASKVVFHSGQYGSYTSSHIDYHVDGNTIYAEIIEPFDVDEGVTVYIPLPQGYYTRMPAIERWDPPLIIGLGLTGLIGLILLIAHKYNRKPVQPVAYNPPDGMNPATVGAVYKGEVDKKKTVAANIIHLANKGYLALEEGDTYGVLKKKPTMDLVFLQNFNEYTVDAHIYKGLSKGRRKYLKNGKTEADNLFYTNTANLSSNFYKDVGAAAQIIDDFLEEHIFKNKGLYGFLAGVVMFANCLTVGLFAAFQQYLPISGTVLSVLAVSLFSLPLLIMGIKRKNKIKSLMLYLLGAALFFGIYRFYFSGLIHYPIWLDLSYILNILIGATFSLYPKRSEEGNRIYGEVLGFKHFIETAEKDRLEMLVEENPHYFYDILPYAYILNITDKWAKRFETIQIDPPKWLLERDPNTVTAGNLYTAAYVADRFDSGTFMKQFESQMQQVASDIQTAEPSNLGDFFSGGGGSGGGGGFSGGGAGGGGGGSW